MKDTFQPKVSLIIDEGGYPFTESQRKELHAIGQKILTEQAKAMKIKIKCTCTVEVETTTSQRISSAV